MSRRTVEVVLTAQVNGFLAGMRTAEQEARRAADGADKVRLRYEAQTKAMDVGGKAALAFGAASAAGIALVVKASAEYGAKMAQLRTLSGATTGTMKQLSDAAMQQGQAFGQSALQVADAEIELQKAGRSTAQILGGDLKGALALAAAGQLDVGKATQIGVTALTQFAKEGPSISHVADLLAAGSDKALGSVEDLGMALNQSGLVASQMGVSIEETTGTLAAFAQNGLLGSDAGTSFKTMLLALQSPSQQAAEQLAKYNIHAYDAEGHFVGMAQLAGQLQNGFKNASQAERDFAMSTIFGTDAIRSANVLFDEGSAGIRKWTKDVDAQGFAAIQAAGKMDSLQGDLTKLSSSFETGLIKAGSSADGGFRGIVQGATNAVQVVSSIPGPVQGAAVGLTALAGAGALVGGAALLAVPKVAALRLELTKLGVSGRGAAGIVGKGGGLAIGVLALGAAFASAGERASGGAADVASALNRLKTAGAGVKDADFGGDWMNRTSGFRDALEKSFGNGGLNDASFAHGLSGITKLVGIDLASGFEKNEKALNGYGQALSAVADDSLPQATKGFQELVKQAGGGRHAVDLLSKAMPDYREKIVQLLTAQKIQATEQNVANAMQGKGAAGARILAAAQEEAAVSAENQAKGIAELAGSAQGAKGDIDALEKAIEGFGSTTLDARAAQAAMQEAIEKAEKEVGKSGKGIALNTKAGRENDAMLRDLASSTAAAAGKTLKMTGSARDAEKQMKDGRAAFIRAAAAAGIVGQKANDLADAYGLIPKNIDTAVKVTGYQAAQTQAQKFQGLIDALKVGVDVPVRLQPGAVPRKGDGSLLLQPQGNAGGGAIVGGPKGVDRHHRILAGGEHVFTAAEVDAMGGQGAVYDFRKGLREGVAGMASGGAVHSISARPPRSIHLSEHGTQLLPGRGRNTEAAALAHHFGGIYDQTKKTDDAVARMARELSRYHGETRDLHRLNAAESRAQKAYDAVGGGKKDRAAKRAAKERLDEAKKRVSAEEKRHEATKKRYEDAKSARDDARQAATQLRQGREDFISAEIRNPNRRTEDPLAYVDELRSASRDGNFSATRRKAMDAAANRYEASLVKLTKSGEAAAKKLDDLKQSSAQMISSVSSAIRGGFTLGGATAAQQTGSWVERNGIRFQTTTTGASGGGIAAYYRAGAAAARTFAGALSQLAGRGINAALLAELAGMGTEAGLPIAQALLSADAGDIASINSDYTAIGSAADAAGQTAADANFAKLIAEADANAKDITAQIKTEGEALRKLLANAYGLKGYASGTSSASGGIHLVGEHGPELVGFRGGERVLNAPDTARWVRGAAAGAGGGSSGISFSVAMPRSLQLVDAGGELISTVEVVARDVAVQEIAADALQDAVLMAGGAA